MVYRYLSIYVTVVYHTKVTEGEIKLARPDFPFTFIIYHSQNTLLPLLLPLLISQQAVHIKSSAAD
jgi:hypothetical protein